MIQPATAADLRHYALPDLQARLEALEQQKRSEDAALVAAGGETLSGDVVTPDAIQVKSFFLHSPLNLIVNLD